MNFSTARKDFDYLADWRIWPVSIHAIDWDDDADSFQMEPAA